MNTSGSPSSSTANRRIQVAAACQRCQKRKAKCSGQRPSCTSCIANGVECVYDVAIGTTRSQHTKDQLLEVRSRLEGYELLIESLIAFSEEEANMLLAELRLCGDADRVITSLKARNLPSSPRMGVGPYSIFDPGDLAADEEPYEQQQQQHRAGDFQDSVDGTPYFMGADSWIAPSNKSFAHPQTETEDNRWEPKLNFDVGKGYQQQPR